MFREMLRIKAVFFEKILRNLAKTPCSDCSMDRGGNTGVRSSQQAQQASTRLRIISTCLAAAGGGVVYAADAVLPADGRLYVCRHGGLKAALWNYGKRPLCRWKSHSPPNGKGQAFPTGRQTAFPQCRPAWPLAHSPTAPTTAAAAKISFPDRKKHHFMVEWG